MTQLQNNRVEISPGTKGVYPKYEPIVRKCPPGTIGVYPNCKPIIVPPKKGPSRPNCKWAIAPPKKCPKGFVGSAAQLQEGIISASA